LDVDARGGFLEAELLDEAEKRLIRNAIAFRILGQNIAMPKAEHFSKTVFLGFRNNNHANIITELAKI